MPVLKPKYIFSVLRGLSFRLKYGNRLQYNVLRTYFGPGCDIEIVGDSKLQILSSSGRVYFSRDCWILCSDGVISIGPGVFFNRGCSIAAHERIDIGAECMFGPNVSVFDADHVFSDLSKPFRYQGYTKKAIGIGVNCWIGVNSVVTKGSLIGNNTVVGANSVVRGILDGGSLYAGQPARKMRAIGGADVCKT